jgi:hypothetical protein
MKLGIYIEYTGYILNINISLHSLAEIAKMNLLRIRYLSLLRMSILIQKLDIQFYEAMRDGRSAI